MITGAVICIVLHLTNHGGLYRYYHLDFLLLSTEYNDIVVHRMLNVLLHSAAAEMVSIMGVLLCPRFKNSFLLKMLIKMFFILHPVHVEAVANAANRPHVLAVLFSVLCCDSRINIGFFVMALMCSLLSSETAIFQFPAIAITMLAIQYNNNTTTAKSALQRFWVALNCVLDRVTLAVIIGVLYLTLRHMFDTLSIPKGLIRPAENPFVHFDGFHRFLNYSYITALHVWKSFGVDFIGRSHEYGFNCIPQIENWNDPDGRIMLPFATFSFLVCSLIVSALYSLGALLNVLMGLSWFVGLFPICGVLRVGTFVADRICMPCTVPVSILLGYIAAKCWQITSYHPKQRKMWQLRTAFTLLLMYYISTFNMIVHHRVTDWMTNEGLLSSSLRACPESAKSNLEISKIYSGLYPDKLDLDKAKEYLEKAEKIDPDYCDIHQQVAMILFQEKKYLEFEERLTNSVICPFSLNWGLPMFQQYWDAVTKETMPNFGGAAAVKRRQIHANRIRKAAEHEQLKDEMEKKQQQRQNTNKRQSSEAAANLPDFDEF